jgi:hypothetical protein
LGLALVLGGLALRHHGRRFWVLQLLPITWVVVYFVFFKWLFFI